MQRLSRNVVYDMNWQALRVSLLGRWLITRTCKENIGKLREYFDKQPDVTNAYRIVNLLNGTMMGLHGMGLETSEMAKEIKMYRGEMQKMYLLLRKQGQELEEVTEERVRETWRQVDKETQKAILRDLQSRLYKHQASLEREDLRWAIKILLDELGKTIP